MKFEGARNEQLQQVHNLKSTMTVIVDGFERVFNELPDHESLEVSYELAIRFVDNALLAYIHAGGELEITSQLRSAMILALLPMLQIIEVLDRESLDIVEISKFAQANIGLFLANQQLGEFVFDNASVDWLITEPQPNGET